MGTVLYSGGELYNLSRITRSLQSFHGKSGNNLIPFLIVLISLGRQLLSCLKRQQKSNFYVTVHIFVTHPTDSVADPSNGIQIWIEIWVGRFVYNKLLLYLSWTYLTALPDSYITWNISKLYYIFLAENFTLNIVQITLACTQPWWLLGSEPYNNGVYNVRAVHISSLHSSLARKLGWHRWTNW